jgi:tRNA A37 threonylcarbamoyladenosine biosynthesis protein TsaE
MGIINQFRNLSLTVDQQIALEKIEEFLDSNNSIFILNGYAGTGKTTLVDGICSYIKSKDSYVKLMAPTGRAAMVLREKTNQSSYTIHKSIYDFDSFKNIENQEEDSFIVNFKLKDLVETPTVIIVDEASMISDITNKSEYFLFGSGMLLSDLIKYANIDNNQKNKIIFIGDNAQLPPVDMNFSPALDEKYLIDKFRIICCSSTLKKVVRQEKQSGILYNATALRESLEKDIFNKFEINTDFPDVESLNSYDIDNKFGNINDSIIITHSNSQALKYNEKIRAKKLNFKEVLVPGDILINTKNNYRADFILLNGMFVKVIEVDKHIEEHSVTFYYKKSKAVHEKLQFIEALIVPLLAPNSEPVKVKILYDFITAEQGHIHPQKQRALYVDFVNRVSKKGIKKTDPQFSNLLVNDEYFNALQLKYGYAITCHKSQGGEWKNVYVDFNVFLGIKTKGFYRWAYTAISRTRKKLYIINSPTYSPLSEYHVAAITKIRKPIGQTSYFPSDKHESFLDWHFEKIKNMCGELQIDASENRDIQYQQRYRFAYQNKHLIIALSYNNNFFNGHNIVIESTERSFEELIKNVIEDSFVPAEIPFTPKFDFQMELHLFIKEKCQEINLKITNIVQKDFSDIYYFRTVAKCAGIEFFFQLKGFYTYAASFSTIGDQDSKLIELINKLKT